MHTEYYVYFSLQADYVTAQQERPESSSIEEYQDTMTPHVLHQRTFTVPPFVPLATPCESGQVMSTLSEQKSKHESLEKDKISSANFHKNDDVVSMAFSNADKMSDNEISSMHQVRSDVGLTIFKIFMSNSFGRAPYQACLLARM